MPYAEKPGALSAHLIFFGVSISVGSITENESDPCYARVKAWAVAITSVRLNAIKTSIGNPNRV
jgi:hypothetical protein